MKERHIQRVSEESQRNTIGERKCNMEMEKKRRTRGIRYHEESMAMRVE